MLFWSCIAKCAVEIQSNLSSELTKRLKLMTTDVQVFSFRPAECPERHFAANRFSIPRPVATIAAGMWIHSWNSHHPWSWQRLMSGCSPGKTGTPFHTAAVWFLRNRAFPSRFDASSLVLPPFYKTLLHFPLNSVRKQSKYANKAAKCRVYCLLPLKHMTNFGLFGCAVKGFMGLCSIILTRRHRYRSPRALDTAHAGMDVFTPSA